MENNLKFLNGIKSKKTQTVLKINVLGVRKCRRSFAKVNSNFYQFQNTIEKTARGT